MANASNILNNTILIPYHDGLTDGKGHQLPDTTVVGDVKAYNTKNSETAGALKDVDKQPVRANQFSVWVRDGSQTVSVGYCQSVSGLKVTREVEAKRSGGNQDYLVNLPGRLKYNVVTFAHMFTNSQLFLDWLTNSADLGGVSRMDIEIWVGTGTSVVYTLRDAFPVEWDLGSMSINVEGLITREKTLSYSISDGQIPVENLKVIYSRLDVKTMQNG